MSPEAPPLEAPPPYASTRLIAYIGNKRALLPFLSSVFLELGAKMPLQSFLDPFAGSGAVSRLARSMGLAVAANDIEEYARVVNECWIGVSAEEAPGLFRAEGSLEAVLERLNRFHPERENEDFPGEAYIARHYAPVNTARADWRRERLFYTHENAVFLDRVRHAIEELRPASPAVPAFPDDRRAAKERALLLGPLLYEAATHANTSGVFKAFHKGFGGHGRDALGRIMAPMRLDPPLLWEGPGAEVGQVEAAVFCAGRSADLCYLDPPYNQHQYGSNYHLLNTLAGWERTEVPEERGADGRLLAKAGIPASWVRSRSAFCSRPAAREAFRDLLSAVDARFIVLSYNSEGLVPPEELFDLLADRAEVSMRSVDYVRYRGGRQSAGRLTRNREILFVAERGSRSRTVSAVAGGAASGNDRGAFLKARKLELAALDADIRLARALSGPFDPERLAAAANHEGAVVFCGSSGRLRLPTYRLLLLEPVAHELCAGLPIGDRTTLSALLEPALAADNGEACEACARLLEAGIEERRLQDLALFLIRKLAHRKYAARFRELSTRLAVCAASRPEALNRLARGLASIETLFSARIEGWTGGRKALPVDTVRAFH